METIAKPHERLVNWLAKERWRVLVAALLVHFAGVVVVHRVALRGFANSGDEYAYLLSAELFSQGRLSAPSPPVPQSFTLYHVINNGRFFTKYPPGWPALLAIGVGMGAPFLVNPLLSCGAIAVTHRLLAGSISLFAANVTAILAATSPFLVFNAASYFAHTACAFFLVCGYFLLAKAVSSPRPSTFVFVGLAAAAAFTIRPYTALIVSVPAIVWLVWLNRAAPARLARGLAMVSLAAVPLALLFLAYNAAQTGSPWIQPFSLYNRIEIPHLPRSAADWREIDRYYLPALWDFPVWNPGVVLIAIAAFRSRHARSALPDGGRAVLGLLAAAILAQVLGQLAYPGWDGNRYGPRYFFETALPSLALAGWALSTLVRRSPLACVVSLAAVIAASTLVLADRARFHRAQITERMAPFTLAEEAGLRNAVVILKTGSGTMLAPDLTRNGVTFDGPVLYALDLGYFNILLRRAFPERQFYSYTYRGVGRRSLVPDPSFDWALPRASQPRASNPKPSSDRR